MVGTFEAMTPSRSLRRAMTSSCDTTTLSERLNPSPGTPSSFQSSSSFTIRSSSSSSYCSLLALMPALKPEENLSRRGVPPVL